MQEASPVAALLTISLVMSMTDFSAGYTAWKPQQSSLLAKGTVRAPNAATMVSKLVGFTELSKPRADSGRRLWQP